MRIKLIFTLAGLIFLGACEQTYKVEPAFNRYKIVCIDGVNYVALYNGVSVKYNSDGKISTCPK